MELIIVLTVASLFGILGYFIGERKGKKRGMIGFWLSFFLSWVGLIISWFLSPAEE